MPTATVSLDALRHNVARVRSHLQPETQLLAAVKANAYGHGAVRVARHFAACGVTHFGVATAGEALELRAGGVTRPILIFSPVYQNIPELVDYDVSLTVADTHSLDAAKVSGVRAKVHLKVDTGMGRLGLGWREAVELAKHVDAAENLVLEGVWTHFAASDEADRAFTEGQLEAFTLFLESLREHGIGPGLVHAANSAGVFAYPEAHFDLVRPGIALYGYHSSEVVAVLEKDLQPALTLTAPVTFVKRVKAGTPVSYSGLWTAPRDTTVATVRVGYADGYPRLLTNKGEVGFKGELKPVAGRVCMDQTMVDVGDAEVEVGNRVTLFGPGGLDAETLAGRVGTISYDLLVSLSSRVERVYE